MKYSLFFLLLLTLCSCATNPPTIPHELSGSIIGTWKLMDASAYTLAESHPHGIGACKWYFSPEGKCYILDYDELLSEDTEYMTYTLEKTTLTWIFPDNEKSMMSLNSLTAEWMVLINESGIQFTLRKLDGEVPYNRIIEPRPVGVLQAQNPKDQLTNLDIHYDTKDYSKLPTNERIVGVWEATCYAGVPTPDFPPYGFPNNKWVFTSKGKLFSLGPFETSTFGQPFGTYTIHNNTFTFNEADYEPRDYQISFNEWGHLVLRQGDFFMSFKLLNKNPKKIPQIPLKTALFKFTE